VFTFSTAVTESNYFSLLKIDFKVPHGQKELVSKARKAPFRISKNLNHPFCGVNLMMKLFDALILYGSEIWGNNQKFWIQFFNFIDCNFVITIHFNRLSQLAKILHQVIGK
jgi:hypothetical protein